jgi:hypothetical protein
MKNVFYIDASDIFSHAELIGAATVYDTLMAKGGAAADVANKIKNVAVESNKTKQLLDYVNTEASDVYRLMKARIKDPGASYSVYQSYHETQAFSDYKWKQYNNGSGIMYAGQSGAYKGRNGYAYFRTRDDWANAFAHELTKGSNPAGATTLENYVHDLKLNGYYQDSESNYLSGLKRARLVIKLFPDEANATENNLPEHKESLLDEVKDLWNKATIEEKVIGGIVILLLLKSK